MIDALFLIKERREIEVFIVLSLSILTGVFKGFITSPAKPDETHLD